MEKKLDGNYTRMLRAVLNKSWRQYPTKWHLYGHLPPITKTIQIRQTRHAGHCWRSKDELMSYVLLWIPSPRRAKVDLPARTYLQQLSADTGCSLEDLSGSTEDTDGWRERVRETLANSRRRWWWWQNFQYIWKIWRWGLQWVISNIRFCSFLVRILIFS